MTDTEAQFDALPVDVRLAIIGGLQDTVLLGLNRIEAERAADVLTRIGYPESAESARRARALLADALANRG